MVPRSVKVGPHTYELRNDKRARADLEAKHLVGEADTSALVIRLDDRLAESALAETALHEILHCIWDQTPLRVMDEDLEESIVSAFAPVLLDVLRSNPQLARWLANGA